MSVFYCLVVYSVLSSSVIRKYLLQLKALLDTSEDLVMGQLKPEKDLNLGYRLVTRFVDSILKP